MEQYILKSIYFKELKCIRDAEFVFQKPLTAIMGVNGSGKTTVIHALACAYQPLDHDKGENYKFSDFFVPNTDSLWNGSEFTVINDKIDSIKKDSKSIYFARVYSKSIDRWKPKYANRPKRAVYYIGIDSCLPDIEKNNTQTRIIYSSCSRKDDISKKVIKSAAYILNKNYCELLDNTFNKKHFPGVELSSGLKYSSLSMGTGEQRTIKILETLFNAEPYSLILIDEIDLLLHVSALKRLIDILYKVAVRKHIQIVFTTHALEMIELIDYVGIQYINNILLHSNNKIRNKTIVYDRVDNDLIYNLTGDNTRTLKIFVEDELAKIIVKKILRLLNMSIKANVIKYGAIENAFTIAAAKVLSGDNCANTLILLDGDKYRTYDEKLNQVKKKMSGTEENIDEKRNKALSFISQFTLPEDTSPEKFFHNLLLKSEKKDNEIVAAAYEIQAVHDTHEWLYNIKVKLNDDETSIIRDIIDIIYDDEEFKKYISNVIEWLNLKK